MRWAVAVAAALLLAGCADAESRVNSPDHITVARPADQDALVAAAKAYLPRLPRDTPRWSHGVVIGEALPDDDWAIRVLARRGTLVLTIGYGCGTHYPDQDTFQLLTDPGDAIRWHWRDTELCEHDLVVTDVGAVR